jgi:hypothetical protein
MYTKKRGKKVWIGHFNPNACVYSDELANEAALRHALQKVSIGDVISFAFPRLKLRTKLVSPPKHCHDDVREALLQMDEEHVCIQIGTNIAVPVQFLPCVWLGERGDERYMACQC